ncbi:MAG: ROK family protein [Rhodospirillales bacterium]
MRIGIDLGGTKIEGIAIDSHGAEHARRRIPTPAGDYAGTLEAIAGLVDALESDAGWDAKARVGVGIPGAVSPLTGRIKNANSTCLIGERLDRDLEQRLGRPVRLENDANCLIVSETADGAAAGAAVAFGVILGTGVGGGLAIHGRPHRGRNAIAGEWGHNALPRPLPEERPGPTCYCGKSGCIETFLSGPGLAADAGEGYPTGRDVADAAARGDEHAEAALRRYESRLARSLASVINVLDPDVIVLAGGLSRIGRLYETVPVLWQEWVFSDQADTPLVPARHGDASGVRGAAWLWPANGD